MSDRLTLGVGAVLLGGVLFLAAEGATQLITGSDAPSQGSEEPRPVQSTTPPVPTPQKTIQPSPKVITKVVTKVKVVEKIVKVPGPTVTKVVEVPVLKTTTLIPPCPTPSGAGVNICFTPGPAGAKGTIKVNGGSQSIVMW